MAISIKCYHCEHESSFDDKWAGKVMRCQKCGGIVTLPKPANAPAPHDPVTLPPSEPLAPSLESVAAQHIPAPQRRAPSPQLPRTRPPRPGPARLFSATLGILTFLSGCAALLFGLILVEGLNRAGIKPSDFPPHMDFASLAIGLTCLLLGIFYLFCCIKFGKNFSKFTCAAAIAAVLQLTLPIALLITATLTSHLNYLSLAITIAWLLLLCTFIDYNFRLARFAE